MLGAALMTTACDDLDQYPVMETVAADVYTSEANYLSVLAKCYALYVTKGQEADGDYDLTENSSDGSYIRNYFNLQESPTDEVFNTWQSGDNTRDITYMTWDAQDPWIEDTYQRICYTITVCNEFIRNAQDGDISGFSESDQEKIKTYRAEARFLRAMSYSHLLDLYRQAPMVTEEDNVGAYVPDVADAQTLFDYIESELTDCAEGMEEQPLYGHAPRAAAWALLAKLYLNAETWTGTAKYTEAIAACEKVFDTGLYSLEEDYASLFNADNNKRTNEIIFPLVVDATNVRTWGATTYLVCGQVASSHDESDTAYDIEKLYGVTNGNGWGMFRITGAFWDLFGTDVVVDAAVDAGYTATDSRALFWITGQSKEVDVSNSEDQTAGYLVGKWKNLYDDGTMASDTKSYGCSIDYPMIRLAEVYLTYAEACARANSKTDEGLEKFNLVRRRAFGDENHDASALDLDEILDERGKELYWECSRRTDLVRYDKLTTSDYIWASKGGSQSGQAVASKYNYYPIPANELTANPNFTNAEY